MKQRRVLLLGSLAAVTLLWFVIGPSVFEINSHHTRQETTSKNAQKCQGESTRPWTPSTLHSAFTSRLVQRADSSELGKFVRALSRSEVMPNPSQIPAIMCPEQLCNVVLLRNLGFRIPIEPQNYTRLFMHVPRSGGSPVRKIVKELAFRKNIRFEVTFNANKKRFRPYLRMSERESLGVIFGPFPYGFHRMLPSPSFHAYFITLRNPLHRWASHFVWAQEKDQDIVSKHNISSWISVEYKCNPVFSMLTGLLPGDYGLQDTLYQNWPTPCGSYERNHHEAVARAKELLSAHFKYVIIYEHLNEGVQLLCDEFGISDADCRSVTGDYVQKSLSLHSQTELLLGKLKHKQISSILEQNKLDVQLYEHALGLHKAQMRSRQAQRRLNTASSL